MSHIPKARKQAVLSKMLSPNPATISALAKQEGISEATLYNWCKQLRQEGRPVPEHDRTSGNWSAQTKFTIVVETVALTETELAGYCRSKGLYPEQIKAWRDAAIASQDSSQQAAADKQHSGIRFVTPAQRHQGLDKILLQRRHMVYQAARNARPERWSGATRNWGWISHVQLNPDRELPPKLAEERLAA